MSAPLKTSIFVDGSNVFYALGKLGWKIDYKRFHTYLESFGEIIDCIYYTGADASDAGQYRFLDWMSRNGYSVEQKPLKTITRDDGSTYQKANLNIELVIDLLCSIDNYELAVIVAGDGDYEKALRVLRNRGKQFRVIASDASLATELRKVVGPHFIELNTLRQHAEQPSAERS